MQNHTMIFLGLVCGSCLVLTVAADEKPPAFFFGGQQVRVGMSEREAVALLSHCCKLSPTVESEVEKRPAPEGVMLGHMILPKEDSQQPILGVIYFSRGTVLRITRPLAEDVDTSNDSVVGFARAIKRSLAADGNAEMTALISIRHEQTSNAESDVVLMSLQDGRGIEIHIGTLDRPNTSTDRRDFVTLDEILQLPRQR